jgi:hypothetical protein
MLPINDILMETPFLANHCVLDGCNPEDPWAASVKDFLLSEFEGGRLATFSEISIVTVAKKDAHFVIRIPALEKQIQEIREASGL